MPVFRNRPRLVPTMTDQAGKVLSNDGVRPLWVDGSDGLPGQGGNAGSFLRTDGSAAAWARINRQLHLDVPLPGVANTDATLFTAFSWPLPGGTVTVGGRLRIVAALSHSGANVNKRTVLSIGGIVLRDVSITSTHAWTQFEVEIWTYTNNQTNTHTFIGTTRAWTFVSDTNSAINGHSLVGNTLDFSVDQTILVQGSINAAAGSMQGRLLSVEVIEPAS